MDGGGEWIFDILLTLLSEPREEIESVKPEFVS
jgi:hypothetical protein